MRIKTVITLILMGMVAMGCKNNNERCLIPPLAPPMLSVSVRIVNKTTGADLFLQPTSLYKFSDLVVTSSLTSSNPIIFPDTTQKTNRFVTIVVSNQQSQKLTIKLASLTADTIGIAVVTIPNRCYSVNELGSLSLDGNTVCSSCSGTEVITIKK